MTRSSDRAARRAVFFDKDGTLVRNVPYNVDPARLEIVDHAFDALARLAQRGYRLFVITNQPGIALRLFGIADLERIFAAMQGQLAAHRVALDGFYACPHAPLALACACRKPAPGLIERAAREHNLDLAASWMVGDILDDVEAGARAGTRTVLLDVGSETMWRDSRWRRPTLRVSSLSAAVDAILDSPMPARAMTQRGAAGAAPWQ